VRTGAAVAIVEDHPLYRIALEEVVRSTSALELVGSFAEGFAALDAIRRLQPAGALVDLRLPDMSGVDLIRAVRKAGLRTRLVVLSASCEQGDVYGALAAGADGYLTKDASGDAIAAALRTALRGGNVLAPGLEGTILAAIQRRESQADDELSAREIQVLGLAAEGQAAPKIASELHISAGTVRTHFANIYEKLGVHDRAGAVMEAVRRGILPVASQSGYASTSRRAASTSS
jgi:two-component system nitrate/nitrite response regulator NarL